MATAPSPTAPSPTGLIRLAFYVAAQAGAAASWSDRSIPRCVDVGWEELCAELSRHDFTPCGAGCVGKECSYKNSSEAWSPVDIVGRRANANVRAVTMAVFDLDDIPEDEMLEIGERLEGYEYLCVSSHSHRPPDKYRTRLLMPLTRPVAPAEWAAVHRAAIAALDLPADPVCKDMARLYYLPTAPAGSTPLAERGRGVALDVDALLAYDAAHRAARATAAPQLASAEAAAPVDLGFTGTGDLAELRQRLGRLRLRKSRSTDPHDREHYELLDRVLRSAPLAEPGNRDNAVNKVATLAGFALPPRTPTGAAVEVLRASIVAMQCDPEGPEYWLNRAAFSYNRAMVRRLERDAVNEAVNERLRSRLAGMAKQAPLGPAPHPDPTASPPAPPPRATSATPLVVPGPLLVAPEPPADWRRELIFKGESLRPCGENVYLILANAEETAGQFVWNEMEKTLEVRGGPFRDTPPEILDVVVVDWLQREWGMDVDVTTVGQRIERAARASAIDPLADYLTPLPARWDGRRRIDEFLLDHCGAVCVDASGHNITDHVRRVSRQFFISLVARGLDPGCQVDTVLILEGPEGFYKTSTFRILGGEWFCPGGQIVLGNKDSLMLAASNWIIEMAELASWRKAESFAMNAFLTQPWDQFRFPYGRRISKCPRRCVFVGTINPEEHGIFPDIGGVRRRYQPIRVGRRIDRDRVRAERDQLFAEAVLAYVAGERWHLEPEEQEIADRQVEERMVESAWTAKIAEWWFGMAPAQRPVELQTHVIAERALHFTPDKISRDVETKIGSAMRKFKDSDGRPSFQKSRLTRNGALQYLYLTSEEARTAVQTGNRTMLRPVAAAPLGKQGGGKA